VLNKTRKIYSLVQRLSASQQLSSMKFVSYESQKPDKETI
jgi:hypothetical protein